MIHRFKNVLGLIAAFFLVQTAIGHNGENHDQGVTLPVTEESEDSKIPLDVGGEFELVDHHGTAVSNSSYLGKHMLVFFGYGSCKNMCSITLTRIGKALSELGEFDDVLVPLVITVDPERDTPQAMKESLPNYHPSLVGLTGNESQLAAAYAGYNQKPKDVGVDWDNEPIISHSSYIYLMDQDGKFATLFPPILNPQSMASIIKKYIDRAS